MFPETTMSLEQQLEEVTKDLPTLKNFVLIGERGNGAPKGQYFCSTCFSNPRDIAKAILSLMIGAPLLYVPIAFAVDKYRDLKRRPS